MEYDKKDLEYEFQRIGDRIRHLRKKKNWSQDKLIEKIARASNDSVFDEKKRAIGRNTLSNIENGNFKHFELSLLYTLAGIFKRDVGHLLCIYDEITIDAKYVQDYTGLSQEAIKSLTEIKEKQETVIGSTKIMLLNAILEDDTFLEHAANILYALHMIPEESFVQISFHDKNGVSKGNSLIPDSSDDLRRLYMADLQSIIFSFLDRQFPK